MSDLDKRSQTRVDIEECFSGYTFPNTEIVDRIQALIDAAVVEALNSFTDELISMYGGWSDQHILRGGEMVDNIHKAKEQRIKALSKRQHHG